MGIAARRGDASLEKETGPVTETQFALSQPELAAGREAARTERHRRQRRQRIERSLYFLSPLALLVLWETLSWWKLVDARFFPRPSLVAMELIQMVRSGELLVHVAATVERIGIAFLFGAAAGVAVGLAMGLDRWVRAIVFPIVAAIYPLPKVAIFPLILIIFGLGETSKIVTVGIAVFFQVLFPTMVGVSSIPRIYLDVGKNFGARGLDVYLKIALPGALPSILSGFRVALGVALIVIVSVEFVGADSGIGYLIWNSWQLFDVNRMFVGLMTAALLGYFASVILEELERRLVPWRL
jgi:NitT/TauT family transport system permease protein